MKDEMPGHKRKAPQACAAALEGEHRGTLFAKVRGKPYREDKAIAVPTGEIPYKSLIYKISQLPLKRAM
jgi:hypothetical protein